MVIYRILQKALWLISLMLTASVCLLNVFFSSAVASTGYETVTVFSHLLPGLLMVLLVGCFAGILFILRGSLEQLEEKKLFRLLTAIYSVMAVYLILNVDDTLRADAKTVFHTALEVKAGIYSAFQPGHYLYRYPHQLGLVLYDQILSVFSENVRFVFLVNFLLVLGINRIIWKLSDELFHDRLTNTLTILLGFAFLPQFFFILFAYSLIPGFFFMLLGFYHTVRYIRSAQWPDMAVSILSVGMAVLLKQNFLIGGIAIGIVLFLQLLKEKKIRYLAMIALVVSGMLLPAKGLKLCYETVSDTKLDNPSPTVLWIAMGTDIDNDVRGPGWYDSSSWNLYNAAVYDSELASDFGRLKLADNWKKIQAEPDRAGRFFLDKTISQWCDPMYESTWSGPLEDCGQYTHTDLLQSIYTGGSWASGIAGYLKLLCLALWLFAAVFLVLRGRTEKGWEPMYLYFIGGLLFHTFWEGKSQYTYPYLFVLIPFAACAIRLCITREK